MLRRHGFTLIELLVVITIIVVLLALLMPALDRAVEAAVRARCAAQLHAWGVAIPQYSFDNRRKLMSSIRHFGTSVYPNLAWAHNDDLPGDWATGATKAEDWSEPRIAPYIGRKSGESVGVGGAVPSLGSGTGTQLQGWGGLWYCPGNTAAKDQNNINSANLADWFVSDYAYFARSDIWGQTNATRPDELTGNDLFSGKLLMADAIYLESAGGYWFNHGIDGHSVHDAAWGNPVQRFPNIAGTNRLTGDGGVAWKDVARFNPQLMSQRATSERWVTSTAANPPDPTGNLNFY